MPQEECYEDGKCYYVYKDAWHIWGRWLLLGLLIAFIIVMVPFSGYLMSRRRMSRGLPPVNGCAWMFPDPYKYKDADRDAEKNSEAPAQQRYRPPNVYRTYQQERYQQEQYRQAQYPGDHMAASGQASSSESPYYPQTSGSESVDTGFTTEKR